MQKKHHKMIAAAACFEALAYLFGFALMLSTFSPITDETWGSQERLTFLLEHKILYQCWILVIYLFFGLALVPLVAGLRDHLATTHRFLDSITPVFGYIWSGLVIASGMITHIGLQTLNGIAERQPQTAATIWNTLEIIQNGLGGGVEIVGGIWVVFVSWQGRIRSNYPDWLVYLGFVLGAAGILTIVPGLGSLGAVFGGLQIAWFIGLSITFGYTGKAPAYER